MRREVLKELKRQGWSRYRLAKRSGVPLPQIVHWLKGGMPKGVTEATINKVMDALKMQVSSTAPAKGEASV